MHPIVRIANFSLVVLGFAVTSQAVYLVALPLIFLLIQYSTLATVLPLLRQLRWLFLSILILHLWFSSPEWTWLPTFVNLLSALERIISLLIIMLAAHLLLCTTSLQEIIATLQWWLSPFRKLGLVSDRVAIRLALVLETIQPVQDLYKTTILPNSTHIQFIQKISVNSTHLLVQVLNYAENTPLRTLEIPELTLPPWWQWGYPLFIGVLIVW